MRGSPELGPCRLRAQGGDAISDMPTDQPWKTVRSRALRAQATPAEKRLWLKLRNRQLAGWKFVRQLPIGPYFADFACREAMLVVEVDGETHDTDIEIRSDQRRDAFMTDEGYLVLRVPNCDVHDSLEGVPDMLLAARRRGVD